MPVLRFDGPFHQSDLKNFNMCPMSFYYNRVLDLDKEKVSMANLAGRAGHSAIEYAHKKNEWGPDTIYDVFIETLEDERFRALDRDLEVHGAVDLDDYKLLLAEYVAKPWNRHARVIALEAEFYFEIKPRKTVYKFEGRIDQLIEIEKDLLRVDFPEQFGDFPKDTIVMHRDTKFGQRRNTSQFELKLDIQFDIYAYALKYGVFNLPGKDEPVPLDMIPDVHAKYFVKDHVPYKNDSGTYLKDESGKYIPCDIVPEPCLVGKTQKPCLGKRSHCTKQRRGPGMYFTTRFQKRLDAIPEELMGACRAIRMNIFHRCSNDLCFGYCQFRSVCEAEINQELEAA